MYDFEVTIRQTITRVVKVQTFHKADLDFVRQTVEEYGIPEAFSDFPEKEGKGSIVTMVTNIKRVK